MLEGFIMKFFLLFISFSVLVLNANLKNVRPPRVDLIMISPPALDASCAVASLPVEAVEAANSFLDAINENDLNRLKLILIDENAFTFLESVLKKHTGLR